MNLVGRKIRGFKFESKDSIRFTDSMEEYIGITGKIISENEFYVTVKFDEVKFAYPIQEALDYILKEEPKELVNHPEHYGGADNPYEAIKVIEAWRLNFNLGSVLKYIARCGKKDEELQELKKARWFIEREIKRMEREAKKDYPIFED